GGDGRNRGGMGFQRIYKILEEDVTFATYGDRFKIAPQGLKGGFPGAKAETFVERGGQKISLESKQHFSLLEGDRLVIRTGGGGGYGEPKDRARDLKKQDILNNVSGNIVQ
ncbi:MAG: hypothetical protein HOJ18_07995, partial [Rhodospirillaceae bacterium]|nr:hypothetical protein [Rhodospirillaceae bacterium]